MTGKLEAVSESLAQYDAMIDTFIDGNKALSQVSKETGEALKDGQDKLAKGTDRLEESKNESAVHQTILRQLSCRYHIGISKGEELRLMIYQSRFQMQICHRMINTIQSDVQNIKQSAMLER